MKKKKFKPLQRYYPSQEELYDKYKTWCEVLGVKPAAFEDWVKLSLKLNVYYEKH